MERRTKRKDEVEDEDEEQRVGGGGGRAERKRRRRREKGWKEDLGSLQQDLALWQRMCRLRECHQRFLCLGIP